MNKKSIKSKNILPLALLICIVIITIESYYLFEMNLVFSESSFNNLLTPVVAAIALFFAYLAWEENRRSNKLNVSLFIYENLANRLNDYLKRTENIQIINRLSLYDYDLENTISFKDYYDKVFRNTLFNSDNIITKAKNHVGNQYNEFLISNSFTIENIDFYLNNKQIINILSLIENLIEESNKLDREYKLIFNKILKDEIENCFKDINIILNSKNEKLYPFNDNEVLKVKKLQDFDVPIKLKIILEKFT